MVQTILVGGVTSLESTAWRDKTPINPLRGGLIPLKQGTVELYGQDGKALLPGIEKINAEKLFYTLRQTSFILSSIRERQIEGVPVELALYHNVIEAASNRFFMLVTPTPEANSPIVNGSGDQVDLHRLLITNCDVYMKRHSDWLTFIESSQ